MSSWFARRFGVEAQSVYRSRDRLTGHAVVIKRGRGLTADALMREVEILGAGHHPIMPHLLAVFQQDDDVMIALEECSGDSLDQHLRKHPEDAEPTAVRLLDVLRHLHRRGVVHGDLKPEHVLVQRRGELLAVRLIDFGLCTAIGSTPRGGTADYLAPEYLRGNPVSIRGELYAWGKTFRVAGTKFSPRLTKVLERCVDIDVNVRPSSADVILSELAVDPHHVPFVVWTGNENTTRWFDEVLAKRVQIAAITAAPGSGLTRSLSELSRRCVVRKIPTAYFSAGVENPLRNIASLYGDGIDELAAVVALARDGYVVFVDDARVNLGWVGRLRIALQVANAGTLILGANDVVASASATHHESLPAFSNSDVESVMSQLGLPVLAEAVEEVLQHSQGRAGVAVRIARKLRLSPGRPMTEVAQSAAALETQWIASTDKSAQEYSQEGRWVDARDSLLDAQSQRALDDDELRLLSSAHEETGALAQACTALVAVRAVTDPDALRLAALFRRAGAHAETKKWAKQVRDRTLAAKATVLEARAMLALGEYPELKMLARPDATDNANDALEFDLVMLDAALAEGAADVLTEARENVDRAHKLGDKRLLAQAESRLGAAWTRKENLEQAMHAYTRALRESEQGADLNYLPNYHLNVATAHHRLRNYREALVGYTRTREVAAGFGREALAALALINRAVILCTLHCHRDAEEALQALGDVALPKSYDAQRTLVQAEVFLATGRDALAAREAESARAKFTELGMRESALEARWRCALAAFAMGNEQEFQALATSADPLVRCDLEYQRHILLRAIEVCLRSERGARAAEMIERYRADVRASSDVFLQAYMHVLSAECLAVQQAPGVEQKCSEATRAIEECAKRLPDGISDTYRNASLDMMRHALNFRSAPSLSAQANPNELGALGRRLVHLTRRTLLESDEERLLSFAMDELITLTRAERAFVLARTGTKKTEVRVARNLDREMIRNSRFRFSRSVAERVLETGEPLLTESATEDPSLHGSRSILDLGLRSILCVPVRDRNGVIGALYLDHRFEAGRFQASDLEVVHAFADIIGIGWENAKLHRLAEERTRELEKMHREASSLAAEKSMEVERLWATRASVVVENPTQRGGIVGDSKELLQALDFARRVAKSDLTILIEGESGTGKELFARYVHNQSDRKSKPFVAINCGALPETLLESELFGHIRGAFTGALRDSLGLFRAADSGTLFLDEVGEMPVRMQARLLRVLQDQQVRPVGSEKEFQVDVRVVAATNRNLVQEVEKGNFRQDLFYRLSGAPMLLPPLRDRIEDIPVLVTHALKRASPNAKRSVRSDAMRALMQHNWPGNVRELEQRVRRAVAVGEHPELTALDLGLGADAPVSTGRTRLTLERVNDALSRSKNNRTEAARLLGVSRVTLQRWVKTEGLASGKRGRPSST